MEDNPFLLGRPYYCAMFVFGGVNNGWWYWFRSWKTLLRWICFLVCSCLDPFYHHWILKVLPEILRPYWGILDQHVRCNRVLFQRGAIYDFWECWFLILSTILIDSSPAIWRRPFIWSQGYCISNIKCWKGRFDSNYMSIDYHLVQLLELACCEVVGAFPWKFETEAWVLLRELGQVTTGSGTVFTQLKNSCHPLRSTPGQRLWKGTESLASRPWTVMTRASRLPTWKSRSSSFISSTATSG